MSMLANGDFDERMFLHPNASEEIGTPSRPNTLSSRLMMAQVLYTPINSITVVHCCTCYVQTPPQHVQYSTPLLRREYLTSASNR